MAKTPQAAGSRFLPTLAILATVGFWGLSFTSSKAVLNTGFPPLTMVCMRFIIASLILAPLYRRLEPGRGVRRQDRLPLVLSGLLGVSIYFFFESQGIKLTSASNAALIIATIPVFTVCAEFLLNRTPIRWHQGLGIALSILGVYFIARRSQSHFPQALLGNLCMLGACLCWVAYILISSRLKDRFSGLGLTAYQALIGAAFLLPAALLERRAWVFDNPLVWLNLLYLGLFCSALSYFLYLYGLRHLGSVVTSTYVNLIPLVGAVGGVAILGEAFSWAQAAGGLGIIAGVFMVSLRGRG